MIALDSATALARSAASSNGLSLTPEALSTAAARLAADLTHEAGLLAFHGAPPFRLEGGQVIDVGLAEHIVAVVRELGSPVTPPSSAPDAASTVPAAPSSTPLWAQISRGPVSDVARAIAASEDARTIAETERWPNPWLPGKLNRTRQQIIVNRNPGLAARFKAQAGV